MLSAIENRELIVLDGLGTRIQGTVHVPPSGFQRGPSDQRFLGRTGVLFLNSLSLPRAASGDSAVHWADSIAEHGYPAFRIDLPGLGDSGGSASTDLLDFINSGGFAPVAAAAAKELVDRFGLSGWFWNGIGALNDNFNALGFAIIGVFMVAWIVSIVVYRYRDLDGLEIEPPAAAAKITPFDRDRAR